MGKTVILLLTLSAVAFGFPSRQALTVGEILRQAEEKIAAAVDAIKKKPGNPFFARSGVQFKEQQELAAARTARIKELLKTGDRDSLDYSRIIQMNTEILMKAPDTPSARTAHWDVFRYNLICKYSPGAREALMTYLHKYAADQTQKKEAFARLAEFAADEKKWDLVLYYAEKGLDLEPGASPSLLNKARALVNLGFLPEGKALLRRVAEANPASPEADLARSALKELAPADFAPNMLSQYRKTMENMRKIAIAAEDYNVEYMKYPKAVKELFPNFLKELTEKDAWGNVFIYKITADNDGFLVASPGSDGVFQGFDQDGFYVDLPGKDIIFARGAFVFAPRL